MMFVCGCLKGTMVMLGVLFSIVVGVMGTSHNPFVWLRYPVSTCWPCLKKLECIFSEQGKADVVAELPN